MLFPSKNVRGLYLCAVAHNKVSFFPNLQVLSKRVSGLSKGLELAAVQCSQQREMVQRMNRELSETREFVEVRIGEGMKGCVTTYVCMYRDGIYMSSR